MLYLNLQEEPHISSEIYPRGYNILTTRNVVYYRNSFVCWKNLRYVSWSCFGTCLSPRSLC